MKYLKTYKLFESLWNKDISESIEDILIDLKDDGCLVDVKYYPGYGNTTFIKAREDFRYSYNILITKPSGEFNIDEKIDQLTSFMESEGYPHMRMETTGSGDRSHVFLFFAKDRYIKGNDNSSICPLLEAKKLDPETNFKGIIDDVMTDARDRGFLYRVSSDKTTHNIQITYRSKTEFDNHSDFGHFGVRDRLEPKTSFYWKDIKDDVVMLVNYLSDIYPKISFNEFNAVLKFGSKRISTKRRFDSVRSILKSDGGLVSYNLKDFMNKLDGDDRLVRIDIQCLARFRK